MTRHNEADGPTGPDEAAAREFLAGCAVGDLLDGTVVDVVPFGAFVDVGDGAHGLIHVSEPGGRPEPGAAVRVSVLAVDVATMRMSLRPA
jgi:ribosomal protein S1